MSDKKVLNIDPNIFNFSNNRKSRKKRDTTGVPSKIRMKVDNKPKKNETLKKRSILNMIRNHQETQYKNKFEDNKKKDTTAASSGDANTFHSGFNDAKDFFKNLEENAKKNPVSKNHTLKLHPSTNNIHTSLPPTLMNVTNSITAPSGSPHVNINPTILPTPKYGCLKNGTLPTYRSFINQTRKQMPELISMVPPPFIGGSNVAPTIPSSTGPAMNAFTGSNRESSSTLNNTLQSMNIQAKLDNQQKNNMKKRKMKRKKTIRRTYKIGRSKITPKVSVLVSNRTIRNNIATKSQLLKQVPLHEMRRYLIKHGFIRVGSSTPNDVLRKMYETTMLMCGEIQNHNPDNLLYNFIHDTDK